MCRGSRSFGVSIPPSESEEEKGGGAEAPLEKGQRPFLGKKGNDGSKKNRIGRVVMCRRFVYIVFCRAPSKSEEEK